ncbi:MAG: hypothetical protein KDD94_05060 [Calditrichaeota bacterium]|nr:hypothetical protein [Calditrichota bacterium]
MDIKFKELFRINGVNSVYAVNNRAEMIAGRLDGSIDRETAERLASHIVKIFAIGLYSNNSKKSTEIELLYDKGRVFAIDCNRFVLIIICNADVSISMVRLTSNVVIKTISEDKKLYKEFTKEVIDKKVMLRRDQLNEEEIALLDRF